MSVARWIAVSCLLAVLAPPALASTWTGDRPIAVLKAQPDGILVRMSGFVNSNSSIACASNDFWLPTTAEHYKERVAFLLAAFMSNRLVNISYVACDGNQIALGSVMFTE